MTHCRSEIKCYSSNLILIIPRMVLIIIYVYQHMHTINYML